MKKIVAIMYRTFVDQGIDLPYFRTIGLIGFFLFIHFVQLSLTLNINPRNFITWNPSAPKGLQWILAAIYFGIIWLVLALIFKAHKLKEVTVTQEEIKKRETHSVDLSHYKYHIVNYLVVASRLMKIEEAKSYAKRALALSKNASPQLDDYPKLGVVKATERQVKTLKDILDGEG